MVVITSTITPKYLSDVGEYTVLNLKNILQKKCKQMCASWCKLPLSGTGRANLIKMPWAPQLMYVLHIAPVWILKYWFDRIALEI